MGMFSSRQQDEPLAAVYPELQYLGHDQSHGKRKRGDGFSEWSLNRVDHIRQLGELHFHGTFEWSLCRHPRQIRLCVYSHESVGDGKRGKRLRGELHGGHGPLSCIILEREHVGSHWL